MTNLAFLGSGLATELHTKTLRAVAPDVRRWYGSRDPERAARMAARHQGAGHFASYEAALASPAVDVVVVAVPPAGHLEWTLHALGAGKHVIVEKPPFLRAGDFDAVETAARRADRQVMVAENYFYKPLAHLLREIVRRGDLGQVRFIHLNALKRQPTGNWRDDYALAGGGALFEGGIHWVSLLANIGLTPRRIRAAFPGTGSDRTRPTSGHALSDVGRVLSDAPERNALVTIEYAEGAAASLFYSWDLPGVVNGVRFSRMYGTAGSVLFETNGVIVVVTGRRPRLVVRVADLAGYQGMMTDFLAAIRVNRPPAYDLALARRDLRLIEEAYASAAHAS
jgi:UDP-N-acetylglucosamine 3-dehydrogenase